MGGIIVAARGGPSKYDSMHDSTTLAIGLSRCIEEDEYNRDFKVCTDKLARKKMLEWSFRANRNTYLHYCVENEQDEMIHYLLKRRSSVNTPNIDSITPLMSAIMNCNTNVVSLMLKHKAKLNQQTHLGENALHIALHHHMDEQIIGMLVSHGSPLDIVDRHGNAPLHHVTKNNLTRIIAMLLKACAALDVRDAYGRTAIMMTGQTKNEKLLHALLHTERPVMRASNGKKVK